MKRINKVKLMPRTAFWRLRNLKNKNLKLWIKLSRLSCIDIQQNDFSKDMMRILVMMIQYLKRHIIWKKAKQDFLETGKKNL